MNFNIFVDYRTSQAITALLRRLGLTYQGKESYGKIRINGLALRRWFQPKLSSPFLGKPGELSSLQLGKGITHQQRNIRTGNLSLEWREKYLASSRKTWDMVKMLISKCEPLICPKPNLHLHSMHNLWMDEDHSFLL